MAATIWRRVRHAPVMAAIITMSLAAGIGVNASVFSWLQAWLLEPLPGVEDSAGLLLVEPRNDIGMYVGTSWLEFNDLRDRLTQIPDLIAFRMAPLYVGEPGAIERRYGSLVSGNYFTALGVRPVLGRALAPGDADVEGEGAVAVISHGLWQSMFFGETSAIGRSLRVNGQTLTVVGVAPDEFQGATLGLYSDVWVPATIAPAIAEGTRELRSRAVRAYSVLGRPAEGATRGRAQDEIDEAMRDLALAFPNDNRSVGAHVLQFWKSPRGPQRLLAVSLVVLQALMLLLLVAVCGNAASLFLSRVSARQKEIGIRLALGATPRRIAVAIIGESTVLGLAGAIAGAALAVWGTRALVVLPLTGLPIRFQTELDWSGLAFSSLLGLLAGVAIGVVPAWQLARTDAQTALRAGAQGASRSPVRDSLMAAEAALATIVLIVAGLFLLSFQETRDADPGFNPDGVLLAAFDLEGRQTSAGSAVAFAADVLDGIRQLPGVEGAAIASSVPLDIHGLPSRAVAVEGRTRPDDESDRAAANIVTPGYFEVMQIPLVDGVDFVSLTDVTTPPQVIVNETFVATFVTRDAPRASALGRAVEARGRTFTIVGVVRDSLYNAFGEPPTPAVYFSYRDAAATLGEIHVRMPPGRERTVAPGVRQVVQAAAVDLPVFNVRTLTEHVETNLVFRRVPARLFVILGPLLLALVGLGIYSLVSYSVSLQTSELGLRLALGATPGRVMTDVMGAALRVSAAGIAVGWLTALLAIAAFLPEELGRTVVFVAVPVLLLGVAAVASCLPASRGARADPLVAIRG